MQIPISVAPSPPAAVTNAATILALNYGSSGIKLALFDVGQEAVPRRAIWHGKLDGMDSGDGHATIYRTSTTAPVALALDREQPWRTALFHLFSDAVRQLKGRRLAAVAHRVVHGGPHHSAPHRVDAGLLAELRDLVPLAPLHQPLALDAIAQLQQLHPEIPQVACFDTAFHRTVPPVEQMLALPYSLWQRGVRRYGFHGLSYEYLSIVLPERHGVLAEGRVIAAHLGRGASLCAMHQLRSMATTMGFSALDGLMMGTRSGAVDPGVLLYLLEHDSMTPAQLGHIQFDTPRRKPCLTTHFCCM